MSARYLYRANWVQVVSGEIVVLNVDLGLNTHHVGQFRLKNVAAGDSHANRETLERLLLSVGDLRVETHNRAPGEGWYVTIFCTDASGAQINLNETLVKANVAKAVEK